MPCSSSSRNDDHRIGGPISANLLEAHDLDRALARQQQRHAQVEEEEDTESEDSAASDPESSAKRDMVETFLAGRDDDFEYSAVDDNEAFDDLETMAREAQERFFDAEEAAEVTCRERDDDDSQIEFQSGILDY